MPIPAPGTYDVASQLSLLAVKAKTDNLPATPASQGDVLAVKAKTDLLTFNAANAARAVHFNETGAALALPAGESVVVNVTNGGLYRVHSDSVEVKGQYQNTTPAWVSCTGDVNEMVFFHDGSGTYPFRITNTGAGSHDIKISKMS